jgi:hypothetical protein
MKGPGAEQNMADKNFNGVQEFSFSQKNVSSQVRGQLFKWYFPVPPLPHSLRNAHHLLFFTFLLTLFA